MFKSTIKKLINSLLLSCRRKEGRFEVRLIAIQQEIQPVSSLGQGSVVEVAGKFEF